MTDPATLSDADLVKAVAEEVLGREVTYSGTSARPHSGVVNISWGVTKDHDGVRELPLNWSGIGQVVEAMREDGFLIAIETHEPCYGVTVWDNNRKTGVAVDTRHGETSGELFLEVPARAVFESALAAVRSVET